MNIGGGFIVEKHNFEEDLGPKRILNVRDAQNLNLKKILERFFSNSNEVDSYLERSKEFPDYERIHVGVLASAYYVLTQTNQEFPSSLVNAPALSKEKGKEGKGKEKGKKGIPVAPDMETQKEVFKTEDLKAAHKADVIRYIKYIKSN